MTLWHGCSLVILLNIFRTSFTKNTSERLPLGKKVRHSTMQNHVSLILRKRLTIEDYLTVMEAKVSKTIAISSKLQHILPGQASITISKASVCPFLDYGEILYDKAFNTSSIKI